jgi:transposase-like protein
VERTNARGRRFFCDEFKAWIVEQAAQPGSMRPANPP